MRVVLIGLAAPLAALAVTAAPAQAQSLAGPDPIGIGIPNAKAGVPAATFPGPGQFIAPHVLNRDFRHHDFRRHRDGDRRRRHRDDDGDVFIGGGFAWSDDLVNNRSWEADSFNGWWHDRPDRAYPRWVQRGSDCEPQRMFWTGGGWRCSLGKGR